jgi:hypothetical protein
MTRQTRNPYWVIGFQFKNAGASDAIIITASTGRFTYWHTPSNPQRTAVLVACIVVGVPGLLAAWCVNSSITSAR